MKKIINNKVYNTETARYVGVYEQGMPSDINWTREELYLKKTGEFFVFASGGANSKYAAAVGYDRWKPGSVIIPLPEEDAYNWAAKNLAIHDVEAIFGETDEDDERVQLHIRLDAAVAKAIRKKAEEQGMSAAAVVESLILNSIDSSEIKD